MVSCPYSRGVDHLEEIEIIYDRTGFHVKGEKGGSKSLQQIFIEHSQKKDEKGKPLPIQNSKSGEPLYEGNYRIICVIPKSKEDKDKLLNKLVIPGFTIKNFEIPIDRNGGVKMNPDMSLTLVRKFEPADKARPHFSITIKGFDEIKFHEWQLEHPGLAKGRGKDSYEVVDAAFIAREKAAMQEEARLKAEADAKVRAEAKAKADAEAKARADEKAKQDSEAAKARSELAKQKALEAKQKADSIKAAKDAEAKAKADAAQAAADAAAAKARNDSIQARNDSIRDAKLRQAWKDNPIVIPTMPSSNDRSANWQPPKDVTFHGDAQKLLDKLKHDRENPPPPPKPKPISKEQQAKIDQAKKDIDHQTRQIVTAPSSAPKPNVYVPQEKDLVDNDADLSKFFPGVKKRMEVRYNKSTDHFSCFIGDKLVEHISGNLALIGWSGCKVEGHEFNTPGDHRYYNLMHNSVFEKNNNNPPITYESMDEVIDNIRRSYSNDYELRYYIDEEKVSLTTMNKTLKSIEKNNVFKIIIDKDYQSREVQYKCDFAVQIMCKINDDHLSRYQCNSHKASNLSREAGYNSYGGNWSCWEDDKGTLKYNYETPGPHQYYRVKHLGEWEANRSDPERKLESAQEIIYEIYKDYGKKIPVEFYIGYDDASPEILTKMSRKDFEREVYNSDKNFAFKKVGGESPDIVQKRFDISSLGVIEPGMSKEQINAIKKPAPQKQKEPQLEEDDDPFSTDPFKNKKALENYNNKSKTAPKLR